MVLPSGVRLVRRIAVTVAGVAVLVLGVLLLALPGPGVLVVALGFFILSTEYAWARRRFESARDKASRLADQAVANPWSTAFSVLAGLALVAAGIVWGAVSAVPLSSWWVGGSLIAGGLICLVTIVVSLRQAKHRSASGTGQPA